MQYCNQCGQPVEIKVPPGDNLPRFVCTNCNTVHYENPRIVAGCVCEWKGRILLCKRAIKPRAGFWTIPAGFMEKGETTEQAAVRETAEEAKARVNVDAFFAMINVPHIDQVHLMFRGTLIDESYSPGVESEEVILADKSAIPWRNIAFPSVKFTLERYFADLEKTEFGVHVTDIAPRKHGT